MPPPGAKRADLRARGRDFLLFECLFDVFVPLDGDISQVQEELDHRKLPAQELHILHRVRLARAYLLVGLLPEHHEVRLDEFPALRPEDSDLLVKSVELNFECFNRSLLLLLGFRVNRREMSGITVLVVDGRPFRGVRMFGPAYAPALPRCGIYTCPCARN